MQLGLTARFGVGLIATLALMACSGGGGGSSGGSGGGPNGPISPVQLSQTVPFDGAQNVSLTSSVSAQFSEAMDSSSFTPATFTLFRGIEQVAGSVSVSGSLAVFTPSAELRSFETYTATIQHVRDAQGGLLSAPVSWSFRTRDTVLPRVVSIDPPNGAINASLSTEIRIVFSEPIQGSQLDPNNTVLVRARSNGELVGGAMEYRAPEQTVIFTPAQELREFEFYDIQISESVSDLQGNSMDASFLSSFKTIFLVALEPDLSSVQPVGQNENTSPIPLISIKFSENLDPNSLSGNSAGFGLNCNVGTNGGVFRICDDVLGELIPGETHVVDNEAFFIPTTGRLAFNTNYTVTMDTELRSVSGRPLASPVSWNFKTMHGWWGDSVLLEDKERETVEDGDNSPGDTDPVVSYPVDETSQPQLLFDPTRNLFHAVWAQSLDLPEHTNDVGTPEDEMSPGYADATTNQIQGNYTLPNPQSKRTIDGQEAEIRNPKLTMDGSGNVYVIFERRASIEAGTNQQKFIRVFVNRLPVGSSTWDAASAARLHDLGGIPVADSEAVSLSRIAASANGVVFAAWAQAIAEPETSTSSLSLVVNRLPAGSSNLEEEWQGALNIDLDGAMNTTNVNEVQLGADNVGNGYVLWQQTPGSGSPANLYLKKYSASAGAWDVASWGNLIEIDAGSTAVSSSQMVVAGDGSVYMAWIQSSSVMVRKMNPNGTLTSIVEIDNDPGASSQMASRPQFFLAPDGTLSISWIQSISAQNRVFVRRLPAGANFLNGWTATPVQVSLDGISVASSVTPTLANDPQGQTLVTWGEISSGQSILKVRRFPGGSNFAIGWESPITMGVNRSSSPMLAVDSEHGTFQLVFLFKPIPPNDSLYSVYSNQFR